MKMLASVSVPVAALFVLFLGCLGPTRGGADPITSANAVYGQSPSAAGGLIASSRVSPGGSDRDSYAYDAFALSADAAIREVRWRGGYESGGTYGFVSDFTVTFYASTANNAQPLCTNPHLSETTYLATFTVRGNAGETVAGSFGGTTIYDYAFVLPVPFQATAGVKYWIRIEALQSSLADWGISVGTGGDGSYYRFLAGSMQFATVPGQDIAFGLLK
jgi:hypothetical protein